MRLEVVPLTVIRRQPVAFDLRATEFLPGHERGLAVIFFELQNAGNRPHPTKSVIPFEM